MAIIVHQESKEIVRIAVAGELDRHNEEQKFMDSVGAVGNEMLHITFLDASILSSRVVCKLYELQQNCNCKIYVFRRYLFSYLYSLGIESLHIAYKSSDNSTADNYTDVPEGDALQFLQDIKLKYGYDYTGYQIESIIRRIKVCMLKEYFKDFRRFQSTVLQNEELFEQLFLHFSINTTEFFRNPEVFAHIRSKVLPALEHCSYLKIWCAGCSTGQEPYSLAILLHEMGLLHKTQIYATDMNPFVTEEAKNGLYSTKGLEKTIENYTLAGGKASFMDYFSIKGDFMEIDDSLKQNILFFQHCLDGENILREFQMILCRNVMIYFTPRLQQGVIKTLAQSLEDKGFLVLGKSEGILHNGGKEFFHDVHKSSRIYRKK